jgi:hypothetical protein
MSRRLQESWGVTSAVSLIMDLRAPRFALACCAAALLAGCAVTTRLSSPLDIRLVEGGRKDGIGLHIPEPTRSYVWRGRINVVPYRVEFGDGLEPNAVDALSRAFGEVTMLETFPPSSELSPEYSISLHILGAQVSPGLLTFSSTTAELQLKALVAKRAVVHEAPIRVTGRWESTPGAEGFNIQGARNQVAYEQALQDASEGAMANALAQLVEALLGGTPP